MDLSNDAPKAAVVINLGTIDSQRQHHAQVQTPHEFALTIDAVSCSTEIPPRHFREILSRNLAVSRQLQATVIVGDPRQLRSRMSILAEQGIRAIVAQPSSPEAVGSRPLPCGLWKLEPTFWLPQPRRLSGLLPPPRLSVARLMAVGGTHVVVIDASAPNRMSARQLQRIERFLEDLSEVARRKQISICSVNEIVANLAGLREVKPQRSILRVAA